MDPKQLKNLLSDNFDAGEISDNDLENELEAILSGKVATKVASSRKPVPREAAKPYRREPQPNFSKNAGPNRKPARNVPINDPMLDISQVEKMLNTFDANESDDENFDDHELLSELHEMVQDSRPQAEKSGNPVVSAESVVSPRVILPSRVNVPKFDQPATVNPFAQPPPVPSRPIPQIVEKFEDEKARNIKKIKQLQIEYKKVALKAKSSGDIPTAMANLKISKQLDLMINNLEANLDVDLSTLPPMPQTNFETLPSVPASSSSVAPTLILENAEVGQDEASKLFNAPQSAGSVLEALEQRLEKFKSTQEQATNEQNASKARRLGRIVKQYESAIKDYKKGKPLNYEELPCPPGFPPIPTSDVPQQSKVAEPAARPTPPPRPAKVAAPKPTLPTGSNQNHVISQHQGPAKPKPLKRGLSTVGSKQLKYLLERQKLFKEAALEAKKRGELDQAKEYLRTAKGFDPLIEATKNGLPIDAASIPTPPQLNNQDFVVVDEEGGERNESVLSENPITDDEREELFRKVEKELNEQIDMCNRNKNYFLKMGDIGSSSKFEGYANDCHKDLNMLRVRWRNGDNIPSYRTETRTFSIVVSNSDVDLNELHVEVVKAFDLPGKPDIDTYVKAILPIPTDKPQIKKTKTVYNTLNPEYNDTLKFEIDRKSRSLVRILKRHSLRLEVYSKGCFLRSDTHIGTVQIKISDLETKATIHECVQLAEGRKMLTTRLELKVKLREPLLSKQIEEIKTKWIVFG